MRRVVLKPGSSLKPIQCRSPMRFADCGRSRRSRFAMARTQRSDSTARKRPAESRTKGRPNPGRPRHATARCGSPLCALPRSVIQTGRSGIRWNQTQSPGVTRNVIRQVGQLWRVAAWLREIDRPHEDVEPHLPGLELVSLEDPAQGCRRASLAARASSPVTAADGLSIR